MKIKKIAFIGLLALLANTALADCTYNGKTYPVDTVLGPYACDGNQWVMR
jgi:hypothetical protein